MHRLSRQLDRLKLKSANVFTPTPSSDPRVLELKCRIEKLLETKRAERVSKPRLLRSVPSDSDNNPTGLRVIKESLAAEHLHGATPLLGGVNPSSRLLGRLCKDQTLESMDTSGLLFLDTETTGLHGGAGTLAFLIGLAWFEDGCLQLEQLMLGNPALEREQLELLQERISRASGIVTYNGRRFDWPLLCNRFVLNRMAPPPIEFHIDLLGPARAIYKRRLGSVRLINIETEVLGFERIGDIDGSEIPSRYWEYIRTAEEELIDPILEHNINDLIAMAAMLDRFILDYEGEKTRYPQDQFGVAKLALKNGDIGHGVEIMNRLLLTATLDIQCEAAILLAKRKQKTAEYDGAVNILESVLCEDNMAQSPELALVLAKLYEHKIKDLEMALFYARFTAETEGAEAHEKRMKRLRRRLKRHKEKSKKA